MVDKKVLAASLDKVGSLITEAQKSQKKLSAAELREAKRTLGTVATELFRMRVQARKDSEASAQKREAIKKSAAEGLIKQEDAKRENAAVVTASAKHNDAMKNIQSSIEAVKKLGNELNKLSSSPELEKLDKGYPTSDAIKAPQDADASAASATHNDKVASVKQAAEKVQEQLMGEGKIVPELKSDEQGLKPQDSEPISQGRNERLENGAPAENNKKGEATGDALSEPTVTASKKKAAFLLNRAATLIAQADKEVDAAKKASMTRRAAMLERMADRITVARKVIAREGDETWDILDAAGNVIDQTTSAPGATEQEIHTWAVKTRGHDENVTVRKAEPLAAAASKKTASVEASLPVFAATEKVLLADGSVATVKSCSGDKVMVSVAGVDKEVLAVTLKKINGADPAPKFAGNSLADKIGNAVAFVRGSKKQAMGYGDKDVPKDAAPAAVPGAELKPAAGGAPTVSKAQTSAVTFNKELNKWIVAISETEVKEFEDEAAAKAFVSKGSKVVATEKKPEIIDSANPKEPASEQEIGKTLKGLDQAGKDGGATTKDEKVNEQQGPIAHNAAKKTATAETKDSPVDSATTKVPEGTEGIVGKIKGLTQQNKGYTATKPEEKMDPKLGPLKEASKVRILEATNTRLLAALAVSEGKILADRAVKVGAIVEAQRSEQETILATLHQSAPAEFKAYARLIANLESNSATPTLANRSVKKVEAALSQRRSTVIDGLSTTASGSLEDGTFFEEK